MKTRAPALVRLLERPASERRIGHFWLVEERGQGGYAPVWVAREMYGRTELRLAAVKLFALDEFGADKDDIIEEARALERVKHPHVASFYSIAIDESIGVMGLAMELLAGRSLEDRLRSEETLSVEETLTVGIAIASALAAAHQAGIIHRDVKPGNIVEDARGDYKLIDFGIAKSSEDGLDGAIAASISEILSGQSSGDVTAPMTGLATGTPGYIDPACAGRRIAPSATSDLYALGATLYRCLSGYVPAQIGKSAEGLALLDGRVTSGQTSPESLASRRSGIPTALATLVDRLIAPRSEIRPRGALQVEHELERIRFELGGHKRDLPSESEGPFRGLRRFEAQDRDVFFGRRNETTKAMELLRGRGLVALVGSSGSGKSSLARAALLPALIQGDLAKWPKVWDVAIVEPGRDPWTAIVAALKPFIAEAHLLDTESLVAAMEERANVDDRGIVLFVDQLEELITTSTPESRDETAALLAGIGSHVISGVRAVVAARTDLLDPLLSLGVLGKVISSSLCIVDPLRAIDWRESVTRALEGYGYQFEDEALEQELFRGIERVADAMPLVEFALAEMWNARDPEKKRLTRASFEKIGGVEGALELHAEATMLAVKEMHSLDVVRSVLLALTTPEGTRRAQSEDELVQIAGESARNVITELTKARLLVPSKDGVTVAHEALLTRWTRLQSWIAEARADRMLAEELERDGARWKNDPESVGLWTSRRLGFARDLLRKNEIRLSETVVAFVRASVRASQRRNAIFVMFGAVLITVLMATGFIYVRAQREIVRMQQEGLETERGYIKRIEDALHSDKGQEAKLADVNVVVTERKGKGAQPDVARSVEPRASATVMPTRPTATQRPPYTAPVANNTSTPSSAGSASANASSFVPSASAAPSTSSRTKLR